MLHTYVLEVPQFLIPLMGSKAIFVLLEIIARKDLLPKRNASLELIMIWKGRLHAKTVQLVLTAKTLE